jgi:hypothetical protein
MPATFRILTRKVGKQGDREGVQVLRIKQLLFLNGFRNIRLSPSWDLQTTRALAEFREKSDFNGQRLLYGEDKLPGRSPDDSISPRDPILFELAYGAGVLIRLAPGGNIYKGRIALEDVHDWCTKREIGFDWDAAVWGLHGYPMWAIVTNGGRAEFSTTTPLALNCTVYVNLMMSVWHQGNAHTQPFNASVRDVGVNNKGVLAERYYYKHTQRYSSLEEVEDFVAAKPNRLYCLEAGEEWVGHEALLFKRTVYECTPLGSAQNCRTLPLSDWISRGSHGSGWICGPSPH